MDFVLERHPEREDYFLPIYIGEMKVSIQASKSSYCYPQETFASSDDYSAFEVALIFKDDWFHPERDKRFAHCSWSSYWSEYDDVAARVPRAEIVQMLTNLRAAFLN